MRNRIFRFFNRVPAVHRRVQSIWCSAFPALSGELRDGAIVAELGDAEMLGRVRDAPVICENRGQNGSGRAFLAGDTVWRL
jgi:hypothetical protein